MRASDEVPAQKAWPCWILGGRTRRFRFLWGLCRRGALGLGVGTLRTGAGVDCVWERRLDLLMLGKSGSKVTCGVGGAGVAGVGAAGGGKGTEKMVDSSCSVASSVGASGARLEAGDLMAVMMSLMPAWLISWVVAMGMATLVGSQETVSVIRSRRVDQIHTW